MIVEILYLNNKNFQKISINIIYSFIYLLICKRHTDF